VTDHPTGEWTAQQFRMSGEGPHRFLIHHHDSIYSADVDHTIAAIGLTILKTPVRSPQANAFCERVIGTIRRECLDWVIPVNEGHLQHVLRAWVVHYNAGVPTPVSGLAFPRVSLGTVRGRHTAVGFPRAVVWSRSPFSAGFITNTVSGRRRPEHRRRKYLRTTGVVHEYERAA